MNARLIGALVSLGALAALIKWASSENGPFAGAMPEEVVHRHIVHAIDKTLHDHQGEDSPIVHAFEEALEEEARHEEALANDTGLKV